MRDLPIVARFMINLVLFVLYWVIGCLVVGIIIYFVNGVPDDAMADKIAIFTAILLLLISLIFRRYFYLLGYEEGTEVVIEESYTAKKKQPSKARKTINVVDEVSDDEEIRIYVDKEIK